MSLKQHHIFYEQRDYWYTDYKFNAKACPPHRRELDQETGMHYYGARYHAFRQAGYTSELCDERPW